MKIFFALLTIILAGAGLAQDRSEEIWGHAQNRIVTQLDASFEDGEFPIVISMLKVSHADEPRDLEVATNLGWMLENVEEYEEAEVFYKKLMTDNPGDPEGAYSLGFFYYMRKRYAEVPAILQPTLAKSQHPNAFRILAKSYERQKKYAEAISVWELQLKKWPGDGPALANIARVKKKMLE